MKTIFISGCLGTVGIFTTNALLNKGYTIIGVDDCSTNPYERKKEIIESPNFYFYNTHFRNEEEMNIFSKYKIDSILHLASKTMASESFKDPEKYCNVNIGYTARLLKLAYQHNVKRFVFESSSAIYGNNDNIPNIETDIPNPTSIYGITKYASEMLINRYHTQYGLETINLRCYNIFAPIKYYNLNSTIPLFALKMLNNEPITLHNMGKPKRQFVHIDNIVHANILALETTNIKCFGEAFNISVLEEAMSLESLVKLLYDELNVEEQYTLSDYVSMGDIAIVSGSIDKAKNILGYTVQKETTQGIKEYITWLKASCKIGGNI